MTAQHGESHKTVARPVSRTQDKDLPEVDTSTPNAARAYDYLLDGTANFAVDREAAERAGSAYPDGIEGLRIVARVNREFIHRAVGYLTGEAGIRQFLDLGTGIPSEDNVHAVAQGMAPESRVVCVDYDPVVLAHAHELMRSTPEGAATFLRGDFRDIDSVLAESADTLDFDKPVAIMLFGILHYITDEEGAFEMVRQYMDALVPGSYLVISQATADFTPGMSEVAERVNLAETTVPRTRDEIARFFDGLEIVEPGIVGGGSWRGVPRPGMHVGTYEAVARKP